MGQWTNPRLLAFKKEWYDESFDYEGPNRKLGVRSCNSALKEVVEHIAFHYAGVRMAIKWVERV
jgi:hypothetical protein